MSNHGWVDYDETPPPDGEAVLILFQKPVHGSLYAIHSSRKTMNGYMVIINGLFSFDVSTKIVAWRRLDDLTDMIPFAILDKIKLP